MSASHRQQQGDANNGTSVPRTQSQARSGTATDQRTSQFAEGLRRLDREFRSEHRPYNVDRWLSGVDDYASRSNARAMLREPHSVPPSSSTHLASRMTSRPASTAPHAPTRITDGQARSNFSHHVPNEELYAFTGAWVNDGQPPKVSYLPHATALRQTP